MPVFKFYDAVCDTCGNWYGSQYKPPQTNNQKDAVTEMQTYGWAFEKGKSFCEDCKNKGE